MKTQYLICGAGILGSALAYELSRRGISSIDVIDADLEGILSSTERNAGGVRHLWKHAINVELARLSIAFFKEHAEEVGFQEKGYLWLYKKGQEQEADRVLKHTENNGVPYSPLSTTQIAERFPFLDRAEDLAIGLFGERDGLINSNALKQYFRSEAKACGVRFHDYTCAVGGDLSKPAIDIATFESQLEAQNFLRSPSNPPSKKETWECERVIFCLGAWTNAYPSLAGLEPKLSPKRRQIAYFSAENFDMSPYGMIVDPSGVYFHPEGGNIIAGLVLPDEPPGFNFDYDEAFFMDHIWPVLYERSSKLERLKHLNGWGGLYHYTPDTTGILGQLPEYDHVFEMHSFTGRGVMQSYGAARVLSDILIDGTSKIAGSDTLSRARFQNKNINLSESLHI